jgi:hypothetical protein
MNISQIKIGKCSAAPKSQVCGIYIPYSSELLDKNNNKVSK